MHIAGKPSPDSQACEASCPHFDESLADHPQLRQWAGTSWDDLWQDALLMDQLRSQCALCNQKAHSIRSLAEHLHREHPSVWESVQPRLAPLMAQPLGNPCKACGQKAARSHMCPVMRQLALIETLEAANL